MIIGIGMDITDVARIEESLRRFGDKFVRRVFTQAELEYCQARKEPAAHFAARFAAKEACAKALGTGIAGGVSWLHIGVDRDENGRPSLSLSGKAAAIAEGLGVKTIHLTMTHTKQSAAATVVLEG